MKARVVATVHAPWLRIYAIRLNDGKYIITGGAIKLTEKMQDRPHTAFELKKIEIVRDFLKSLGVFDDEGFIEYLEEIS